MLKYDIKNYFQQFRKTLSFVSSEIQNTQIWQYVAMHFTRSNRVSQNPAIILKNKARQSKTKTRFPYDG